MSRSIGIMDFLDRKFDTYPIEGDFLKSLGEVERNFRMIIYGASGNGKTEFAIQLAKHFAQFTKVYYNSYEQGISKTLQDALIRNNMQDVKGRVLFGDKETFAEMCSRLESKNAPQVIIIDSRDYINLTTAQFKILTRKHKRKAFIILCWERAKKPKGIFAQEIEFMCDIKIRVSDYKAYPRSRFGGNAIYTIWDKKSSAGSQLKLL
jgi:hypothetical protein